VNGGLLVMWGVGGGQTRAVKVLDREQLLGGLNLRRQKGGALRQATASGTSLQKNEMEYSQGDLKHKLLGLGRDGRLQAKPPL